MNDDPAERLTGGARTDAGGQSAATELAAILNGREYCHEITKAEEAQAKAAGLVVVFGYSDDNVELRGAIDDEVGAFDGTTFRISPTGLVPSWSSVDKDDEDEAQAYFDQKRAGYREIEAVWCPDADESISWIYRTDIPHATFDVMEDGATYCRGIVFALADAAIDKALGVRTEREA